MVTQVAPRINQPDVQPLSSTLLDHATVIEGIAWLDPVGLYESYNCLMLGTQVEYPCPTLGQVLNVAAVAVDLGGTVPDGDYEVWVTATNANGETTAVTSDTVTTDGDPNADESIIQVSWDDLDGATGYNVYISDGTDTYYVSVAGNVNDHDFEAFDVGDGTEGEPPTSNTARVGYETKTFNDHAVANGIRFAVYAGLVCRGFGAVKQQEEDNLTRLFALRESVGVESALMTGIFPDADDITPTPGTGVTPEVAVALLEGDAARNYAGVPTIHMSRTLASLLFSERTLVEQGGLYYTRLGTKVVAGAGYDFENTGPGLDVPDDDDQWMFVTGEVQVARGDLVVNGVMNTGNNEQVTLVERPYLASVDCYQAAVLVEVY